MMFIIPLAVIFLPVVIALLYFLNRQNSKKSLAEGHRWRLGVDHVVDYVQNISVNQNQLKITGWQKASLNLPVKYSVVKRKLFLFPIYYESILLKGNYSKEEPFSHTFHNLPNGEGYCIEIYNFAHMSRGELFVC